MKQDFTAGNTGNLNLSRRKKAVEEPQLTEARNTRSKKGQYLKRVNVGISEDNFEFLSVMSGAKNMPVSEFINVIIDEYRQPRMEAYKKLAAALAAAKDI